jgi:hypothetical protein
MTEIKSKADFIDEFIDTYSSMTDQERLEEFKELADWDTTLMDGLEDENDDRYQHQSWLARAWRRRHYLPIPFVAFRIWRREQARELRDEHDWRMTLGQCWGLAIGLAQSKMKWYYTSAEIGYPDGFAQYADDDKDLTSDGE